MLPRQYPELVIILYRFPGGVVLKFNYSVYYNYSKFMIFDETFSRTIKLKKNKYIEYIKNKRKPTLDIILNISELQINDINLSNDYHFNMRKDWIFNHIRVINPIILHLNRYCLSEDYQSIICWCDHSRGYNIVDSDGTVTEIHEIHPNSKLDLPYFYIRRERYYTYRSYEAAYNYYQLFQFSGKLVTFQAHQDISFKYL